MDHQQKAAELFDQGYNCSQSVFAAYAEEFGLSPELALRLGAPFGGGMGRMGEVCGAISGALMVLGLSGSAANPTDPQIKALAYERAKEFMVRFAGQHGSCLCRELIGYDISTPEGLSQAREQDVFHKRCPLFVRDSAEILDEMLYPR